MTTRNARSAWRKSSRSTGNGSSNCVEARSTGVGFEVRDSKLGDGSPIFDLGVNDFLALLTQGREHS
jgi:hypothetical protein